MRSFAWTPLGITLFSLASACASEGASEPAGEPPALSEVTLAADVTPVTRRSDALDGVFIQPFLDCRPPLDGEAAGDGPEGQVCTQVAISGATEPGRYFADYADCDIVLTQRPYWQAPPAGMASADDPRLQDEAFMGELAWATEQLEATACSCCHDGRLTGEGKASQWDITAEPIWLDTLSDTGLSMFAGLSDSYALGAYPADDNNGFDREALGVPTTDIERMRALLLDELQRRGISEAEAMAVPPFGGPVHTSLVDPPTRCGPDEGIDPGGKLRWKSTGGARYVYVLADGSDNPGVPPNLDNPAGTLWRLDVRPDEEAVSAGFAYGVTPAGSFQATPADASPAPLEVGEDYLFAAYTDIGLPLAKCLFTFGELGEADDAGGEGAGGVDDPGYGGEPDDGGGECDDSVVLGDPCTADSECGCAAEYCAVLPGASEGYCTPTGCLEDASVCPDDWGCFDVSAFIPGAPSICTE